MSILEKIYMNPKIYWSVIGILSFILAAIILILIFIFEVPIDVMT